MEFHGAAFPLVPLPRGCFTGPPVTRSQKQFHPWFGVTPVTCLCQLTQKGKSIPSHSVPCWEWALNGSCWAGTLGHPAPLGVTPVPAPSARAWRWLLENPGPPVAALTPYRSPTGSRSLGDQAELGTDHRSQFPITGPGSAHCRRLKDSNPNGPGQRGAEAAGLLPAFFQKNYKEI